MNDLDHLIKEISATLQKPYENLSKAHYYEQMSLAVLTKIKQADWLRTEEERAQAKHDAFIKANPIKTTLDLVSFTERFMGPLQLRIAAIRVGWFTANWSDPTSFSVDYTILEDQLYIDGPRIVKYVMQKYRLHLQAIQAKNEIKP